MTNDLINDYISITELSPIITKMKFIKTGLSFKALQATLIESFFSKIKKDESSIGIFVVSSGSSLTTPILLISDFFRPVTLLSSSASSLASSLKGSTG